ncbi:hypothetical protein F5Y17DRAFT_349409 [Xylariaceae sp. FL0594]|nr:hypothetical protein F5Y17DRAFT_349409 [Xylariaceae sp. FL0594]
MEMSADSTIDPAPAEKSPNQDVGDDVEPEHHNGRGVKRPAEDDLEDEYENTEGGDGQTPGGMGDVDGEAGMSKSQLKKLKRRKKWEENRSERRLKRKDKRHERQARKREARQEEIAAAAAEGREPKLPDNRRNKKQNQGPKVPLAIIVDCQFEKYMLEQELVSLTSQVTRCYSDNRNAQHPVHLYVSSYGGYMKDRYENVLDNQHASWKGIRLSEKDFMATANEAKEWMAGPKGGKMIDVLQQDSSKDSIALIPPTFTNPKKAKLAPTPEPEADDVDKSIVYLTADSPYTLERLEPNTCYVVGGIIDKNREKGLCYKIAREKKVRTAKLPIGEYMVLQHRHILATNHVVEIMLKWLETGDWATAFMQVIPSRKGGTLKASEDPTTEAEEAEEAGLGEAVDTIEPGNEEAQVEAAKTDGTIPVEGDNAEEGLQHNTLAEQTWLEPPPEVEAVKETADAPTNLI